mgnify:CR=1 FL=1
MKEVSKRSSDKSIIKKCHVCGHVHDTSTEVQKCVNCKKSFLPTKYFDKVHTKNSKDYKLLFSTASDIHEDDLIKGISVIW